MSKVYKKTEGGDVKSVETGAERRGVPGAFQSRSFRSMKVEGTFTQREVDEFMAQAKREGKQEGTKEAERRLMAPVGTALENIERILDEFSKFRRDLFKESEQEITRFISTVCKRVVMRELQSSPDMLQHMVTKGLEILEKQRKVVVELSAADFEIFSRAKPEFLERFKVLEELEFMIDARVEPGTAILKTKGVELDVNLEQMVDHLLKQMFEAKKSVQEANNEGDKY